MPPIPHRKAMALCPAFSTLPVPLGPHIPELGGLMAPSSLLYWKIKLLLHQVNTPRKVELSPSRRHWGLCSSQSPPGCPDHPRKWEGSSEAAILAFPMERDVPAQPRGVLSLETWEVAHATEITLHTGWEASSPP